MISVHQRTAIGRHSRHPPLGSWLGNGSKNGGLTGPDADDNNDPR
jgi:hypothetical protein